MRRVRRVRGKHLEIVQSASTSISSHSFSPAEFLPDTAIHRPITTFVDVPSEDGRRMYREVIPIDPPSPIKSSRACSSRTSGLTDETCLPSPVWSNVNRPDERYIMFGDDNEREYEPPRPPSPKPRKALFSVSQKQSNLFDVKLESHLDEKLGSDFVPLEGVLPRPLSTRVSASRWMRRRRSGFVSGVQELCVQSSVPVSRVQGRGSILSGMLCQSSFGKPTAHR
jgi:hypothetical protein